MSRAIALAACALALAACVPEEGPLMEPGHDCLRCHSGGDAPHWTVAGTVFPRWDAAESEGVEGAKVHLTDQNGRTVTVTSNQAGNFYTAESLAFPIHATITKGATTVSMEEEIDYGGCNRCHAQPPQEEAPGRVSLALPPGL